MATRSILYVEDNDDIRETIGMLLEGEGREVVLCASAEATLPTEIFAATPRGRGAGTR